jgi:hypothetical protein
MSEIEQQLISVKRQPPQIPQSKRHSVPQPQPQSGNYYQNKRSRLETSIIEENEEAEDVFFDQINHANNPNHYMKQQQPVNYKPRESANQFTKNAAMPLTNNKNQAPQRREKEPVQQPQQGLQPYSDQLVKKSKMTKKVTLEEKPEQAVDKEALMKEFSLKHQEIERQIQERREKVKRIMSLTKLYEKLYVKMEDFKNKMPNLVQTYLDSYQRTLQHYHTILSIDDPEIDSIISQTDVILLRIKEKFQFN